MKHYFEYKLEKVLIIRSYTPLLEDIVAKIRSEFPDCVIDLLQVKNGSPIPDNNFSISTIHTTLSSKGFLLRHLIAHFLYFRNQRYDAVFPLYGTIGGLPNTYNLELYAYLIPARYHIGFDSLSNYKVINIQKLLFRRTVKFIASQCMFIVNIITTCIFFIYAFLWMLLLSPLTIFHKRKKRSTVEHK